LSDKQGFIKNIKETTKHKKLIKQMIPQNNNHRNQETSVYIKKDKWVSGM